MTQRVTFTIPDATKCRLDELAASTQRKKSNIVVMGLEMLFERENSSPEIPAETDSKSQSHSTENRKSMNKGEVMGNGRGRKGA